jgi:hypothetical protein
MKTKNQLKAFFGLGALSLLTATTGGLTTGCVADRPSRNLVYDENQYIRKDFLVRAGDDTNPDYGWMLKATITSASEPNVFGGTMYSLFAGAHSDGELVHFVITSDTMEMVDNRQISSDPSVGTQGEVVNAWPITNVDLKYLIDLNGEKTNQYGESQELDWQVRQWVKVNLDKNNMNDLAPLGSFVTTNLATCVSPEGSGTLVPNSFIVDEAHDYLEWSVEVTLPISWADNCMESYGAMGPAAQNLNREFETVTLKYSMTRAVANPQAGGTSFAENQNGNPVPAYQPLVVDEKDPILHKYSPFIYYSWNVDPDTGLLASNKMVMRHNPAKDQRWYFEKGFPDQYKNIFTSTNLPPGVAPLPAGIPTIQDSTNQLLAQANGLNKLATGRISFHEYNEPLDDGTPIERAFGDVRFNMLRWVESLDQQTAWVGNTGFIEDPRTGEMLTTDIVFENNQLKDYYANRIDAYLQSIGASPGLYAGNWGPSPFAADGVTPLPTACTVGQTAPIVPTILSQSHNGLSSLYQKIQSYLYEPASQFGPLGPQNFIVPQDADFLRAYYAYLPYIIYADPATNPYVTPESNATNTSPSQQMWAMIAQEQQLHAIEGQIDRGYSPYDTSSPTGSTDALTFLNNYQALTINHRNYMYAQDELSNVLAAHQGGTNNNAADGVLDFTMEQVMAKDARQCISSATNPTPHWETAQEWIDSLMTTYWSQVMWHEFGHSQGLTHNFMGSVDGNNFPLVLNSSGQPVLNASGTPQYKLYSSSVMEYNAEPDRVFWGAGWGPYDMGAIAWIYSNNGSTQPLPQGATAPTISGQLSSTFPWNDPNGFAADGKTEKQFLLCNESHEKYTPLCRKGDLGITPSEITANDLDHYEWEYAWRNFRTYHKVWDDSAYGDQPMNFISESRRFLSLWSYDMSSSELTSQFQRIGITPPPDAPSAQLYYQALTNKFNTEMSGAASLMAAFHEAIITQSSGQRPYITQFNNYFGDVTEQGIQLDKLDSLESFVALWPVDNYDPLQAAGAYISSFAPYGLIASVQTGTAVGSLYETVAEQAVTVMLGGSYASFPYTGPFGEAKFTEDTQSINYNAYGGRQDAKDWTGGWYFTRSEDFLSFFQNIAVQNGFTAPQYNIKCDNAVDCAGGNGFTAYDPRTPIAYATDTYYSSNTNQFVGPDGKRYIWVYVQERNAWVVCDQDRHIGTYQVLLAYNTDVVQGLDDGNVPGAAYGDLLKVEYFIDYYIQFNNQYVQANPPGGSSSN